MGKVYEADRYKVRYSLTEMCYQSCEGGTLKRHCYREMITNSSYRPPITGISGDSTTCYNWDRDYATLTSSIMIHCADGQQSGYSDNGPVQIAYTSNSDRIWYPGRLSGFSILALIPVGNLLAKCTPDSCRVDCPSAPDGFCCIDHATTNRLLQTLQG